MKKRGAQLHPLSQSLAHCSTSGLESQLKITSWKHRAPCRRRESGYNDHGIQPVLSFDLDIGIRSICKQQCFHCIAPLPRCGSTHFCSQYW